VEPPYHPLYGSELRVGRAYEHMLELREELIRYIESHKGIMGLERDEEAGVLRPVRGDPPPFPPRVSILIGEVAYNLRSALDYIVYVLAVHSTGRDVKRTQFPIVDSQETFYGHCTGRHPVTGKRMWRMMRGLKRGHVMVIEAMQPYHPESEWTRTLRQLSNPDKHRTLTPLQVEGRVHDFRSPSEIVWQPGQEEQEVDLRYRVEIEPQLTELDLPLLPTLKLLHDEVALTVDLFKQFFGDPLGV